MTDNPFHDTLDWALQGKYARVVEAGRTYEGWIERVHHGRGSVVMHNVTVDDTEELGSVFIRTPDIVEVIETTETDRMAGYRRTPAVPRPRSGFRAKG